MHILYIYTTHLHNNSKMNNTCSFALRFRRRRRQALTLVVTQPALPIGHIVSAASDHETKDRRRCIHRCPLALSLAFAQGAIKTERLILSSAVSSPTQSRFLSHQRPHHHMHFPGTAIHSLHRPLSPAHSPRNALSRPDILSPNTLPAAEAA